jgi:CubicO group peptidase (beta-lactamase class C family)
MKNYLLIGLSLFVFAATQAQTIETKVKEFDAYVEKSFNLYQVPGLALTVVKDGKVIFKKGYGVSKLGTTNMVDTQTLFGCGSTTKAMTATCMAILVDEGKVKWDDPVINYLPDFQLYDPYMTRELKIRDLFTHNSGLGNADFLWSIMNIPSDQILSKMKLVKPSYSLRSSFIYQNIFYVYAGKVIEKVSGQTWEEFIQKRIFQPLGMTRTYPTLKMVKDANQSHPHYWVDNKITVIERTSADVVGPAGSVWSCADDMSKWALCMLDSSKYAGGRLVKASTWTEMFKPQVMVTASQFYPTAQLTKPNWTTYGLGWFQQDYKGKKINYHTGSLAGETAIHGQLPDDKLAIYIFGNYDHAEIRHALMYKAFDLFALGGTRDWSGEIHTLYKNIQAGADKGEKTFEAARVTNTKPSHALDDYTGRYTDPLYGELMITRENDELILVANQFLKARVSHWHYDTFRGWFDKRWYGKINANFTLDDNGKVSKVSFDGIPFTKSGK